MKWLKEKAAKLLIDWLGLGYVEKVLSWLPANNAKTITAGVVTAISVLVVVATQGQAEYLHWFRESLVAAGGQNVATSAEISAAISAFLTLLGLFHKWLKRLRAITEGSGVK